MNLRQTPLPEALEAALLGAAGAARLLVASDFDGTLSPIVADHDAAAADPGALEPLLALASLPRTDVVVISGRARSDLASRIGSAASAVALIGSHGAELAEGVAGDGTVERADVDRYAATLADLVRETPGVSLERKPFSLAVHYRNVDASRQEAVRGEAIERVAPMAAAVKEGKKVVEFFAIEADKGTALVYHRDALRRRAGDADRADDAADQMADDMAHDMVCLFVGDDVTDEAAFERLQAPDVTVKVGPGDTAAAHTIADREGVASLLRRLHQLRAAATEGETVDSRRVRRGSGA